MNMLKVALLGITGVLLALPLLILKMVGITYVAEFSMNVCKDAGYAAIANQIEVFAKISILAVSLPVFVAFLETIGGLI